MNKKLIALIALVLLGAGAYFFTQSESALSEGEESVAGEVYVYETEVDGADQCTSYETYDAEAGVCRFECESEAACADIEAKIDAQYESWLTEDAADAEPVAEKEVDTSDSMQASYTVSNGEQITFVNGTDDPSYRAVWDEIAALSPNALSNSYIGQFDVFDSPEDDTLAFVDQPTPGGPWRIAVNLAGNRSSTERERKMTYIHELFHIISLNASQVESGAETCDMHALDEGCPFAQAYITGFWTKFWQNGPTSYEEGSFVTEYAATNEVEDAAESFTFFVLSSSAPVGSSLRDQKVAFFYTQPELMRIRAAMRSALAKDVIDATRGQ